MEFCREISTLSDFNYAARERSDQLGLTREGLDHLAGWADRYGAKLLSSPPQKIVGSKTFAELREALCLRVIVVSDAEALERKFPKMPKAERPRVVDVPASSPEVEALVRARLRQLQSERAKFAASRRWKRTSADERRQATAKATQARWSRRNKEISNA